jgi:hypothetical protein
MLFSNVQRLVPEMPLSLQLIRDSNCWSVAIRADVAEPMRKRAV